MLRAAAAPERFLTRGFVRLLERQPELLRGPRKGRGASAPDLGVALPVDLATFLEALAGASIADFAPRPTLPRLQPLLASARRGGSSVPLLVALLAGAVPFGETGDGEPVVYFVGDPATRGLVAVIDPRRLTAKLVCRGAAELAVICSIHACGEDFDAPPFGLVEEESVRSLIERARALALVLTGTDAQVRRAVRALDRRPLDVPTPDRLRLRARKGEGRTTPLALGALVEAFFREPGDAPRERIAAHAGSADRLVRDASALLGAALASSDARARTAAPARELARRRAIALRALRHGRGAPAPKAALLDVTRRIVERIDVLPPDAESFAAVHERGELLLALARLGDRAIAPELLARAVTGDAQAVDMLAALGDRAGIRHLAELLDRAPTRSRRYEAAVVRALAAHGAKDAAPMLRRLLEESPLTGWREGLERGGLVRDIVLALGDLADEAATDQLVTILGSTSQEYRAVLPAAAHALGRLRSLRALPALEALLSSPKEPVSCEAVSAVGLVGQAHASAREHAAGLLDRLTGLEPGAEATRLSALAKLRPGRAGPRSSELRRAIGRALFEPAFRQEETSRRRAWGLRAVEDLASIVERGRARSDAVAPFLGHEAVCHFITRDDHRVRAAAERAFAAWGLSVPKARLYFTFALPDLEQRGGLDALHEAVRDPLGVFRHNVATRLAEIGDPRSTRPLAEATARLFMEPPTSTYEYDDAPPHLVAFVRALAKLNAPEGNDVLIHGLRSESHQVRAVIAENAPDDERIVPELMVMLEDPRSFLRSRAEKSLTSLGALPAAIEPATTEIAALPRLVEV